MFFGTISTLAVTNTIILENLSYFVCKGPPCMLKYYTRLLILGCVVYPLHIIKWNIEFCNLINSPLENLLKVIMGGKIEHLSAEMEVGNIYLLAPYVCVSQGISPLQHTIYHSFYALKFRYANRKINFHCKWKC